MKTKYVEGFLIDQFSAGRPPKRVIMRISDQGVDVVHIDSSTGAEIASVRMELCDGLIRIIIWDKDTLEADQEPQIIQLA